MCVLLNNVNRNWLSSHRSSLWRNRLARSTVNRKVGGSSPPKDGACFFVLFFQNSSELLPWRKVDLFMDVCLKKVALNSILKYLKKILKKEEEKKAPY